MKVVIFENQFYQVKIQFDVANRIFFNNKIEYVQFNSSQEFGALNNIINYDLAIIDISLSSNSDLDGYDLITQISEVENHPKILILTGNSSIEQNLKKRNLPSIPILMKPVDAIDIRDKIISLNITSNSQNSHS